MGPLGYSPLPINLVLAGFDQVQKLHDVDPGVSISAQPVNSCNNPTFVPGQPNTNHLAQIAPMPAACDKEDSDPCTGVALGRPGSNNGGNNNGGNNNGGNNNGGPGGTAAGPGASASASGSANPSAPAAGAVIDPDTGAVVGGDANGGNAAAAATPTDLAAFKAGKYIRVLAPLSAGLLLVVLFVPAILNRRLVGRPRDDQ
jgi:hypothetical protein